MNTTIKYFLRHKETKLPASYATTSNDGCDFCVEVQHTLCKPSDYYEVWYANTRGIAEQARITDTGWYKAGIETPSHSTFFNPSDYEVVKRTLTHIDEAMK